MSVNKILNRPMFRKAALKKGHLKPIHAQTGVMVGAPTQDIRNTRFRPPAVVPQPGFMQRAGTFAGRLGRDIKSFPRSVPGQVMNPRTRVPFGMGGGLGRFVAGAGLYDAISAGTTKLGMQPGMLKTGVDLGLSGLLYFNPIARAGGLAYGAYNMARPLVGGAVDYVTQRPMGTTSKALDPRTYLGEPSTLGTSLFTQPTGKRLTRKERRNLRKQEKAAEQEGSEVAIVPKEADDALTVADNKTKVGNQEVVDITKVANNTGGVAPVPPSAGAKDTVAEKGFKLPEEKETDTKLVTTDSGQTGATTGEGKVTAADGTKVTDDTIARARQIRDELMQGKSSQAKLVFLANLAAGLMSGTTAKAGIGGALEVFGKALGPAVNNYATIKLKENELENEFMSDALEIASEEIDAKNAVLEAADYPDATPGVVRMLTSTGQAINVTARRLKDGTVQIAAPGAVDANGRQIFTTVTPGEYVTFRTSKGAEKGQFETLRDLSAKYKAYNLGIQTINILENAEAEGKKFAGPAGRFNLFTTRLGDALRDFGINISSIEDGARIAEDLRSQMRQGLINDGKTAEEADKILDKEFGSTQELKEKIFKNLGTFADQTDSTNLERLAINETVMVYALANSLKSKDRLTQKDIQMAKDLVNVFPLLRGQRTVIKSLQAVNETVLSDIKRLETDYLDVYFGDSYTINKYRQTYGIIQPDQIGAPGELQNPFSEMSTGELLENF